MSPQRLLFVAMLACLPVATANFPAPVAAQSPWIVPLPEQTWTGGPTPSHRIIEPPAARGPGRQHFLVEESAWGAGTAGARPPGSPEFPSHGAAAGDVSPKEPHFSGPWASEVNRKMRAQLQPPPPAIPGARQTPVWKTPYSYGHFGASGKKHWSMHYGYRDRYTQWTLR